MTPLPDIRKINKLVIEWQKYLKQQGINTEALTIGYGLLTLLDKVYEIGKNSKH